LFSFRNTSLNIALLGVVWTITSCTYRISVPESITEPTTVYLIDHGRTSSLALPNFEGSYIRYAYGDHRWYARDNTGIWQGLAALFWPTPGALGRSDLGGDLSLGVENIMSIEMDVEKVKILRQELEAIHQLTPPDELISNAKYNLVFSHHPNTYSLTNNSNTTVAGWLRRLGCDVESWPWAFDWEIVRKDPKEAQY